MDKDKENKNAASDGENNDGFKENEGDNYLAEGLCLGMSFGLAAGQLVFDNIGIGMVVGMCLGMAVGANIKK